MIQIWLVILTQNVDMHLSSHIILLPVRITLWKSPWKAGGWECNTDNLKVIKMKEVEGEEYDLQSPEGMVLGKHWGLKYKARKYILI